MSRFKPINLMMKLLKPSDSHLMILFSLLALASASATVVLSYQYVPRAAMSFIENVETIDATIPAPVPSERYLPYVWKMTDLYERENGRWRRRAEPGRQVSAVFDLAWDDGKATRLQLSGDRHFSGSRIHFVTSAAGFSIDKMYLGENFWRISRDGLRWSESLSFVVEPETLPDQVRVKASKGRLHFSSSTKIRTYVLEFSRQPEFASASTFVFHTQQTEFAWDMRQLGYLRARGVDAKGELTEYSPVVKSGSL
ncbi:MAG: hypothetical protein KF799_07975 [Bdellovibrionales bacterium]|nr:hypothetical protein [Bdellovibrionales bacterium]